MRIWNWMSGLLLVCGLLVAYGIEWNYLDQYAITDWERRITATAYHLGAIFCLGVHVLARETKNHKKNGVSLRFCGVCDSPLGSVRAVVRLKTCPECDTPTIPVEDRTYSTLLNRTDG